MEQEGKKHTKSRKSEFIESLQVQKPRKEMQNFPMFPYSSENSLPYNWMLRNESNASCGGGGTGGPPPSTVGKFAFLMAFFCRVVGNV